MRKVKHDEYSPFFHDTANENLMYNKERKGDREKCTTFFAHFRYAPHCKYNQHKS